MPKNNLDYILKQFRDSSAYWLNMENGSKLISTALFMKIKDLCCAKFA